MHKIMEMKLCCLFAICLALASEACGSKQDTECTSHYRQFCSENRLWWQNSCSEFEEQISVCACGCADGNLGCNSNCSNCTPRHHTICINGEISWVDSCGQNPEQAGSCECGCNQEFTACEESCACEVQNPNASVICASDAEYWVDNCGDQGAKKADCECGCNQEFTACKESCDCEVQNPNASVICASDAEYWVDNCGDQGAKKADCECGCNLQGLSCESNCGGSAPIILNLGTNLSSIDRYDQLVISAVVTDPDGIDDLIGGVLADSESGSNYGAFVSTAQEGSYTLTLNWDSIQTTRPIYSPEGGGPRMFKAEFYDQAGHKTSQNVEVSLICNTNTSFAVCNGQCADLNNDKNHCGACDNPVTDPLDRYAYCADRQKTCSYSFDLCDGNTDCTWVMSDTYNCGQCNRNCWDYSADGAGLASAACDGSQYLGTCTGIAQISEAISCQQLCSRLGMSLDYEDVCENDGWDEYGCVYYVGGYVDRLNSDDEIPLVGEGDWALSYIQCACQDRL